MYVIVTGNPADGFDLWGTFKSHDDAVTWAEEHIAAFEGDWWVLPIQSAT